MIMGYPMLKTRRKGMGYRNGQHVLTHRKRMGYRMGYPMLKTHRKRMGYPLNQHYAALGPG